MGAAEHGNADDVGDREIIPEQPIGVAKRCFQRRGSVGKALTRALRYAVAHLPDPPEERALELAHPEQEPLIDARAVRRSKRWDQASVGVEVGKLKADRCRLEHNRAVVEGERGNTSEWMTGEMLCGPALFPRDKRQLERGADFLEEPQDASRARAWHIEETRQCWT